MKVKITFTAHGYDSDMVVTSHAVAAAMVKTFLHGIGCPHGFEYSRARMDSHGWQKCDMFMQNAQWYAGVVA